MAIQIPKTLGATVDKLYRMRAKRLAEERKIKKMREDERVLETHLIESVSKQRSEGIIGREAKVKIITKDVPTAKDWPKIQAHILKTKDFSLLQRRLSDTAIRERWDAGEKVPGVDVFHAVKVSVTKK